VEHRLRQLARDEFPSLLTEIADPPEVLYVRGNLPEPSLTYLTVIGSRSASAYAREALTQIIHGLRGLPIVIVSGLALGIDTVAHRAALDAGLTTIAIPGSGLLPDVLYPRMNIRLAEEIVNAGGALLSEFAPDFKATPWSFPKRNRIMAGLSHATFVVEGARKSGTLITARLAMEYNRDVLALPGPITHTQSAGPHYLIQEGAALVTDAKDVASALDVQFSEEKSSDQELTPNEICIWNEVTRESLDRDALTERISLSISEMNATLSVMELKGLITISGGIIIPQKH